MPNAEPTNAEAFNAGSEGSPAETSPSRAITLRAIVVGLVITYLTAFWVREAEIKSVGVFVSESVPTIPAVASLLLLLAVNHLLRRRTRHAFSRGELLFIFFFVTVATTPYNCGVVRIFLAFMTAPFYFMAPENKLAEAQKFIPQWAAVHDLHAVRGFYEGLPGKPVPWDVWIVPVLVWVGFFMALWLAMACLIMLMHRPWIEKEKLGFPLFQLPLRLTDVRKEGGGVSAFLRNPVMWIGFGIAFFSDGTHMLHAVFPYLPAFGKEVSFPTFTEPPWNALGPITLFRRPILIGFGYLVSTEITFSVWATFWLERLMAVLLSALGNREPGNPYMREQGFGAFIAVALVLLYINRQHLAAIIKSSVSRQPSEGGRDRWALWGFALSVLTLVTFCRLLGMLWWVGLVYIGIFLAFALTVARIRAEVGIPLAWLFPYGMQKTMVISTLGTAPLSPGGSAATLTALATLAFMQFSNTVSFAGYQVESLRMGRFVGEKPRRILVALTGAFLIGLLLSFYFHIATFFLSGGRQCAERRLWSRLLRQLRSHQRILPRHRERRVSRCPQQAAGGGRTNGILNRLPVAGPANPVHRLSVPPAGICCGERLRAPSLVVVLLRVDCEGDRAPVRRSAALPKERAVIPGVCPGTLLYIGGGVGNPRSSGEGHLQEVYRLFRLGDRNE